MPHRDMPPSHLAITRAFKTTGVSHGRASGARDARRYVVSTVYGR